MRTVVRSTLIAGMTGVLMVSAAWAGIGLSPLPVPSAPSEVGGAVSAPTTTTTTSGTAIGSFAPGELPALGQGQILVGAAKISMNPRPDDMKTKGFPNARWERNAAKCRKLGSEQQQQLLADARAELDHIAAAGSPWPENPNCIYQGGFDIGPVNPITSFDDPLGVFVRSVAFSDGTNAPYVMTVVDAEGWLWDYKSKCATCGAKQIAASLAADPELAPYKVSPKSFILHATHSHSAPEFIGGWGFVPDWYMAQITQSIKDSAKQALLTMEPAVLEAGEVEARALNNERRDTYRSAEEAQLSWLRAVAVNTTAPAPATETTTAAAAVEPTPASEQGNKNKKASPSPSPVESPSPSPSATEAAPRVIATLGTYAAHPTSRGKANGVATSDWVGYFEKRLEERFGGIGLHFMTGLGNMSSSKGVATGTELADLVPPVGQGLRISNTTVKVAQTTYRSPLTNVPLTALGTPGFFDRKFDVQPAAVRVGKESETAPCVSASAQSVELPISAASIGDKLVFTTAPGEVFSNLTNTIKEKNPGRITFPMGQVNDSLGYMPQSFELNPASQQGLGLIGGGYVFINYEDGYAIDKCVGDGVLEGTLTLLGQVR